VFWLGDLAGRSDRGGWEFLHFPLARLKMGLNVGKNYRNLCDLHGYFLAILCRRIGYDDIAACVTYCNTGLEVFSDAMVRRRSKLV
jgi:hypothetical protein